MAPKGGVCCGEETVVVSVYVEMPRRKVSSSNPNRRYDGHYHHLHHHRHRKVGSGYDRRADLLLYSQQLRETARGRSAGPTPDQHSQLATNHPQHTTKIWIPQFIKSWVSHQGKKETRRKQQQQQQYSASATDKLNTITKHFNVQKKWGFATRLFSAAHKRR